MQRHRTLIGILLGLMLLVQGFAVSAAPRAMLANSATVTVDVMANVPCHQNNAQKAQQVDDSSQQGQRACCNASCPDMTTCALGHLASVAAMSVSLPQPVLEAPASAPVVVEVRTPTSLLRPPITSHG